MLMYKTKKHFHLTLLRSLENKRRSHYESINTQKKDQATVLSLRAPAMKYAILQSDSQPMPTWPTKLPYEE